MGQTQATHYPDAVSVSASAVSSDECTSNCYHSVINTFKSMVVDEDVLEKEDLYILYRMKKFISNEEVLRLGAARQLLILIEKAVRLCSVLWMYVIRRLTLTYIAAARRSHQADGNHGPTGPACPDHTEDDNKTKAS